MNFIELFLFLTALRCRLNDCQIQVPYVSLPLSKLIDGFSNLVYPLRRDVTNRTLYPVPNIIGRRPRAGYSLEDKHDAAVLGKASPGRLGVLEAVVRAQHVLDVTGSTSPVVIFVKVGIVAGPTRRRGGTSSLSRGR